MTIGERIQQIRRDAGLSMAAFGSRIGVNPTSVNKWEKAENHPSERTIRLICSEFRVNYQWLVEGTGDVYSNVGGALLDMLVAEYHLSDLDKRIMEMYLMLNDEQRAGIHAFVNGLIESGNKKQGQ